MSCWPPEGRERSALADRWSAVREPDLLQAGGATAVAGGVASGEAEVAGLRVDAVRTADGLPADERRDSDTRAQGQHQHAAEGAPGSAPAASPIAAVTASLSTAIGASTGGAAAARRGRPPVNAGRVSGFRMIPVRVDGPARADADRADDRKAGQRSDPLGEERDRGVAGEVGGRRDHELRHGVAEAVEGHQTRARPAEVDADGELAAARCRFRAHSVVVTLLPNANAPGTTPFARASVHGDQLGDDRAGRERGSAHRTVRRQHGRRTLHDWRSPTRTTSAPLVDEQVRPRGARACSSVVVRPVAP